MSMQMPQRSFRLSELLEGFADIDQLMDCDIQALTLDSRQVGKGDLFFACAGTRQHGLDYAEQVCKQGAAAIAWEPVEGYTEPPVAFEGQLPFIEIKGLSQQLGYIADRFYGSPSEKMHVIGITGTDGKTSCSHFIAHALNAEGCVTGVMGTLGYGLLGKLETASHTTPDTIRVHQLLDEMHAQGAEYVVMEVSSHALDQGRVNGVIFEVAVLTNISRDHLDYHGDEAAYISAKQKLFEMPSLRCAILNLDDVNGRAWAERYASSLNVIGYSINEQPASVASEQLRASDVELHREGLRWTLHTNGDSAELSNHLFGRFNVYNLLVVMAALQYFNVPRVKACEHVQTLQTIPGRMEFHYSSNKPDAPVAIVDFAHTPDALKQVLGSIREHGFEHVWCVFGCGGDRDQGKRPLMGQAAESLADQVVVTDDNPRTESGEQIVEHILAGMTAPEKVHVERKRKQAIEWALTRAGKNDVVLIAGKGHEDYQLVGNEVIPFSDREVVEAWMSGGMH